MRIVLIVALHIFSMASLIGQKYTTESNSDGTKLAVKEQSSGKLISDYIYDDIEIKEHYALLFSDNKYGLMHLKTGIIFPCDYTEIEALDSVAYPGLKAVAKKGNKKGLIGLSDKGALEILIPFKYDEILEFSSQSGTVDSLKEYLYCLTRGKKASFYNLKKRALIVEGLPVKGLTYYLVKNYIVFGINHNKKFVDGLYRTDGELLLKPKYQIRSTSCIDTDIFEVHGGGKTFVYDFAEKKYLIEPVKGYLEFTHVNDRFQKLQLDGNRADILYGYHSFIDIKTGKPVLTLDYNIDVIWNKDRYAVVEKDEKVGIFDFKELKLVVPCIYADTDKLREKEVQYFD